MAKIKKLKITQTRSLIGRNSKQKKTIEALGLRRIHHSVEHNDTPQIRGMLNVVGHIVTIDEV